MSDAAMDSHSDSERRNESQGIVIRRRGRGFKKGFRPGESSEAVATGRLQVDLLDRVGENAEQSIEGWTIGVTGIHREASEDDVLDRFAEFGEVKTLHLNLDRHDGYVKGYALVEYEFFEQAKEAVAKSDRAILLGQEIRVDFAFVKPLEEEFTDSSRLDATHSIARRLGPKVEEDDEEDFRGRNGRQRYSRRDSRPYRERSPRGRGSRSDRSDRRDWDHPENHTANSFKEESDFSNGEYDDRRSYRRSQRSQSPRRRN
ncbi:hypothetical protein DSO57_1035841 [Entomophthora muscae]|uniref:Uncharacterized protein n=1 Tax=Entomophthora muscae TaxID=34485 RepID=A0ACC2TBB3_9FUNG|nr:hypothetical protein DSO57_1035841 [Entomophthora muscae]